MRSEVYSKSKWSEMKKKGKKRFLRRNLILYWLIGLIVMALFNEILINVSEIQVTQLQRIIMQVMIPLAFYSVIASATTEKVWIINEDVRKNGITKELLSKFKVLTFIEYICMLTPFVVFNMNSLNDNFAICIVKFIMLTLMTVLYTVMFTKTTTKAIMKDLEISEKRKYRQV